MNDSSEKYFLAANSAEGFISYFGDFYNPFDGWKAYIIKGGPGTGKSSFMRFIAKEGEKRKLKVEYFPCSSDPHSLDGVSFPKLKTVIMDGTAPHIVDPKYIGVCENLLDFGVFWDKKNLLKKAEEIIKVTLENKEFHKTASDYIKTAGNLIKLNYQTAKSFTDYIKTENFANKLIKKHIPKTGKKGFEWVRFSRGITPDGVKDYTETFAEKLENIIILNDEYGAFSTDVLERIRKCAIDRGYEIITIQNSVLPSVMTDGVIIPELSLGIIREYGGKYDLNSRRIRFQRFIKDGFSQKRKNIKFNSQTAGLLLSKAVENLAEAKFIHDKLEKYYVDAMDFNALSRFAEDFMQDLF